MKKSTKNGLRKLRTQAIMEKRKEAKLTRLSASLENDYYGTTQDATFQECREQMGWPDYYESTIN
jgi:hypothetical protein